MVLTNIELWAADGSNSLSLPLDFENTNSHTRHLNPFDPRVVPQINSNLNHLSSNGYYGFSYINAAHDVELNNNNNTSHINNNISTTCNLMANDVNGMNNTLATAATTQQTHASLANNSSSASAGCHSTNVTRCKKRFFVMDDNISASADTKNGNCGNNCEISAKRCRFDDDFSAQYCNDFFQLPSTQIATQSCLMDTEEELQQQQQADVAMFENNNNIGKYEPTLSPQLQTLAAHNHQQHYQDIQIATIKCHFNHKNCDTLALNNHTRKIDLQKNTEYMLEIHNPNVNSSIQNEHDKHNNDVANDFKVDDATLFAQLHGGCLHHYDHHFNNTVSISENYSVKKMH